MISDLMERCEGKWNDLLLMNGLDRRHLNGRHGPCPMCGGKDRFRFTNWQNRGGYCCNQCGHGDGAKLLMLVKNWDFKTLAFELERQVGTAHVQVATAKSAPEAQRISMANLWRQGRPVERGDPVDMYLRRRGLEMPRFPETLRYHPNCFHKGAQAKLPAMLVRVDGPDGHLSQVQQTFLGDDGSKASVDPGRLFHWGPFEDGSAARIGKPNGIMGIAEGYETSLAVALIHKFAVWAALSAQLLLKWSPPKNVEEVYIFGDNDANFTGQAKAYGLANRLAVQNPKVDVTVCIPDRVGADWNDVYADTRAVPSAPAPTATEDEISL